MLQIEVKGSSENPTLKNEYIGLRLIQPRFKMEAKLFPFIRSNQIKSNTWSTSNCDRTKCVTNYIAYKFK